MSRRHLDDLRVQARYARERYDLYKAKTYGPRLTSPARMRELSVNASGQKHASALPRPSSGAPAQQATPRRIRADEILQSGFQLDIPRMFAALFLITLAGVALFAVMIGLSKLALGQWHESEVAAET